MTKEPSGAETRLRVSIRGEQVKPRRGMTTLWILRAFALRMTQRRIARISLHPKKPDKRAEQGHNHNLETKINFRQDWIATSFNEQWAKPISRTKVRSFSSRRPRGVQIVRRGVENAAMRSLDIKNVG